MVANDHLQPLAVESTETFYKIIDCQISSKTKTHSHICLLVVVGLHTEIIQGSHLKSVKVVNLHLTIKQKSPIGRRCAI